MGIIHKLSSFEAQKIAAGEVVERPYNIVKELLENSLDAGATHIALYVQDGGRQSIRCIDNGCGMTQEDAFMSVEHHATSKLTTIEDLETIKTFGFRGEALSSICSVSKMTLATQMHNQEYGVKIMFEYGTVKNTDIISQAPGTDIAINNILDNVPVRKKFLKTRETEWRAIFTLVQAIALAHKHVAFTLFHDNQQVLLTHATDSLQERVAQIFDRSFSEQFLVLKQLHDDPQKSEQKNSIAISGGITHYQYQRYDRNQQFFFVNNRWVKNYKLGQAFSKGFQNVMPPNRYPAGIIFIQLPQAEVDINVHPRKEEVVFLHPRLVELALEKMVQKTLEDQTANRLQAVNQAGTQNHLDQETARYPNYAAYASAVNFQPSLETNSLRNPLGVSTESLPPLAVCPSAQFRINSVEPIAKAEREFQQPITINPEPFAEKEQGYTVIGQLLKTYLLLETQEGLLLVDQHAAHESVLYEQFSSKTNEVVRIQLLFPEIIPVSPDDQKILLTLISELNTIGIHIEPTGQGTVAVTETPLHLKNYPLKELVHDILSWIHENSVVNTETWNTKITKKLYAMMACKAAIKAGDELSSVHIQELLTSLYKTEHRLTCPHGRPTTWVISQYELEKAFKRKI